MTFENAQPVPTCDFVYPADEKPEERDSIAACDLDPHILLRTMCTLYGWAGRSNARLLAVQIVTGQDRREVREASLSAKLDRTHVYRCIREARKIIAETTAQGS